MKGFLSGNAKDLNVSVLGTQYKEHVLIIIIIIIHKWIIK